MEDKLEPGALARLAARAEVSLDMLNAPTGWLTTRQTEAVLRAAREAIGSDQAFGEAAAYQLAKGLGPLKYVLWSADPSALYVLAVKSAHLVSRVGH